VASPAVAVRHDVVDDDGGTIGSGGEGDKERRRGRQRERERKRKRKMDMVTLARGWHSSSGG